MKPGSLRPLTGYSLVYTIHKSPQRCAFNPKQEIWGLTALLVDPSLVNRSKMSPDLETGSYRWEQLGTDSLEGTMLGVCGPELRASSNCWFGALRLGRHRWLQAFGDLSYPQGRARRQEACSRLKRPANPRAAAMCVEGMTQGSVALTFQRRGSCSLSKHQIPGQVAGRVVAGASRLERQDER